MNNHLPRQIEDLCNRVAAERVRPLVQQHVQALRNDVALLIESGRETEAVVQRLRGLLAEASVTYPGTLRQTTYRKLTHGNSFLLHAQTANP